jgi:hypothetical protein
MPQLAGNRRADVDASRLVIRGARQRRRRLDLAQVLIIAEA